MGFYQTIILHITCYLPMLFTFFCRIRFLKPICKKRIGYWMDHGVKFWTFYPAQRYARFFIITQKITWQPRSMLLEWLTMLSFIHSRWSFCTTCLVRSSDNFVFAKMELEVHYFTLILTHNIITVWHCL